MSMIGVKEGLRNLRMGKGMSHDEFAEKTQSTTPLPRERPILFSAEMVNAILAGRKTETRRVITCLTGFGRVRDFGALLGDPGGDEFNEEALVRCPYGQVGDRLWVRESWAVDVRYDAVKPRDLPHDTVAHYSAETRACGGKKRPSIFMPRWMSRITLEITEVHFERIQDIAIESILAEGVDDKCAGMAVSEPYMSSVYRQIRLDFTALWDKINAKRGYGWEKNPWVWVLKFRRAAPGSNVAK